MMVIFLPWPANACLAVPFFVLSLLILTTMARQVRLYIISDLPLPDGAGYSCKSRGTVVLHSFLLTLIFLSDRGYTTLGSAAFCLFIFRLSLTDLISGFLPREWTVACLVAGLLYALGQGELPGHVFSALFFWLLFAGVRQTVLLTKGVETLGLGDAWLAAAVMAWLGWDSGLVALGAGMACFVAWHLLPDPERPVKGGPLGPWLGYSALLITLFSLWQPAVVWK